MSVSPRMPLHAPLSARRPVPHPAAVGTAPHAPVSGLSRSRSLRCAALRARPGPLTWVASAVACVLGVLAVPTARAQAATPPAAAVPSAAASAPDEGLEKVVVSTRKRLELSQTVPVAVSAFSGEALDRAKIAGAADLQFSIPNAVLTGNDRFTIRGIGNNSLGGDNGVGLAINGANITLVPYDELYDLERIEVLRGPQGTLFGRNTTGGALALVTRRPTGEHEGHVSAEIGNFDHRRIGFMLNVPVSENLRQRFAGYWLEREGFTRNQFTGNRVDGRDQYSVRSSTRLFIGDGTELNLVLGSYGEDSSRTREGKRLCKAIAVLGCSPVELGFDSPNFDATLFRTLSGPLANLGFIRPGANLFEGAPNPADLRAVAADFDATFFLRNDFGTLELTHELPAATLTWTAGYSRQRTEQNTDWDNAALPFRFNRPVTYSVQLGREVTTDRVLTTDSFFSRNRTVSNELRLASRGNQPLQYTTGLFYLESEGGGGFLTFHPYIELIQKVQGRGPETWYVNTETRNSVTRAWAWFGEAQWRASERLRATLGARYTHETRNSLGRSIVLTATRPFTAAPELDDGAWTTRASVDWTPSADLMVFGSVATGYKGGGFNTGSESSPTFRPEKVTAYEVGVKSEFSRTLRLNVSAFYNDYKDMQIAQRISASAITANTDATTKGIEAELLWVPNRTWQFDANLSLLRTRIGTFFTIDAANPAQSLTSTTPAVQVNLAGRELPHSPRAKIKLGAQYSHALPGGWSGTWRIDHAWQDAYYAREFNTATDRIAAWSVTNLQWRARRADGRVEWRLFVKNAADKDNITNIIIEDALVGRYRNVRLLDPRTYGLQVQYNF
jgi:iron complex outermembrane receptor protein